MPPTMLTDRATGQTMLVSEIRMFGDTVIRWLSGDFDGPALPNYEPVAAPDLTYGIGMCVCVCVCLGVCVCMIWYLG